MAYSFLISAASITLLVLVFAPAPSVAATIVDTDGDIVRNGRSYNIIPRLLGTGGLTVNTSSPCPLRILQKHYSRGSPVRISSPENTIFLRTSSYGIEFSFGKVSATCNKPLRWWVAPQDANDNRYVILGSDEPFVSVYAFKIEEAKHGKNLYNIKFCRLSAVQCDDVTFLEDGFMGVAPNAPFPVAFEKVSPQVASSYV